MKTIPILCLAMLLATACGAGAARREQPAGETRPPAAPVEYTYSVRNVYPHLRSSYTQGLLWADGVLWEGTGQHGESVLQRIDLATGGTETVAALPEREFGEGIALLDGKIYQLTWQSNTAHVYDAATGRKLRDFAYPGEGWGLTTDGVSLYMSDGSATIRILDPATFRRKGSVTVTCEGHPVEFLNELEWIDGKIWANVYTTDAIVVIDPATGVVEGIVDLTGLLPVDDVTATTDVLNGIAYDPATKRIFVTGKNWPKLFEIAIEKK